MSRCAIIGCALLLAALPACSSRAAPGDDDAAARDALAPDAALADSALPDAPLGPFEGLIYLAEVRDSRAPGSQQGTALATFTPAPHPFFSAKKTLTPDCAVYGGEGEDGPQYSAGRLTFSGGTLPFELEPKAPPKPGNYLYPGLLNPDYFSAGDTITVAADGALLPPFSGDVRGVGDLDVTPPSGALTRGTAATVRYHGADPSADGTVWVLVLGAAGGRTNSTIRCRASLARGSFEIPGAVLAALPAADDAVVLAVGQVQHSKLSVTGNFTVNLVTTNIITSVHALY